MDNEENNSIFTFDPGEPPEDFVPEEENSDEVIFDWEPIYDIDPVSDEDGSDEDDGNRRKLTLPFSIDWKKILSSVKAVRLPKISLNINKYMVRRIVAVALAVLLIVVPAVSLIIKAVRDRKPVTTENVGPLPTDEVAVHRVPKYYDYGKPAPESPVSADFFDDALIVGDTRLVQLLPTYGVGSFRKILYGTAINVSNALEYDSVNSDGDAETLASALGSGTYGKIYICLGLNELGWSYPDVFESDYDTLIQDVRRLEPGASIYLMYIVPVLESEFDNEYINNTRIKQYNEMILSLALKHSVYCIDCYTGMADAAGSLAASYTSNGFYINEDGARAWWNYISSHTVDPEVYEN